MSAEPTIAGCDENPEYQKGTIWFENALPFQMPLFDPRAYFINSYIRDYDYNQLLPNKFPIGAEFIIQKTEPNLKEGGLYMEFKYKGGTVEEALESINQNLKQIGFRSPFNFRRVNAFQVKGTPWVEDLVSRTPSQRLHVQFYGPDLTLEALFREFRVFGRIVDISFQPSSSKELPRYASVEFLNKRAATSARNCIHGEVFDGTKLDISYEKKPGILKVIWDWGAANMRIAMLILLAVVATITYAIFDPWRVLAIKTHITGSLDFTKYKKSIWKFWEILRAFGLQLFNVNVVEKKAAVDRSPEQWQDRERQEKDLNKRLQLSPDSFFLINGPRGSGKSGFIQDVVANHKYKLVINCDELVGKQDYHLLSNLCSQVHFFPAFGFLTQVSGFVDALITATTGAKAQLSTTNEGEISKVLECVTLALEDITESQIHHFRHVDVEDQVQKSIDYPVVIIEDFLARENIRGCHIYDKLAVWAAQLAEYRFAHVVFVSDNPAAARVLGKILPHKSIQLYTLSDAQPQAAYNYINKRLGSGIEAKAAVQVLGGRLHDLEIFVNKMLTGGTNIEGALSDMISKAVSECRKLGQLDEMRSDCAWSPVQFWKIVELLAKYPEVSFDEVCFDSLFKGDAKPLDQMERAGLISCVYQNNRPYTIRPGRPIYAKAFSQMVDDKKLSYMMKSITAKQLAQDNTKKVAEFQLELEKIANISLGLDGAVGDLTSRKRWLVSQISKYAEKAQSYLAVEEEYKAKLKLRLD